MVESHLVAILVNCYLLLEHQLAVLPCWLPRVVRILLTSLHRTSHSLVIATGLRDVDRSLLGLEGRPKAGSAGRMPSLHRRFYELGSPVQNLTLLKFQTLNLKLNIKYTKICTI